MWLALRFLLPWLLPFLLAFSLAALLEPAVRLLMERLHLPRRGAAAPVSYTHLKRYGVNLEVLSSFSGKPGTKVKEVAKTMEKLHVSGVACDKNVARVAVVGLADEPGIAFKIFSLLAKERINVDLILQSIGRNNTKDISFTVSTVSYTHLDVYKRQGNRSPELPAPHRS